MNIETKRKLEILSEWVAIGFLIFTLAGVTVYCYYITYHENAEDVASYMQTEPIIIAEDYNTMHAGVVENDISSEEHEGMQPEPIWLSAMYGNYEKIGVGTRCMLSLTGEDGSYKITTQSVVTDDLGDIVNLYFECEEAELIGDCLVFQNFVDGRRLIVTPDSNGDILVIQTHGNNLFVEGVYQKQKIE